MDGRLPIRRRRKEILQGAQQNEYSLCLFKPKRIVSFTAKFTSEEYSASERQIIQSHLNQGQLFSFEDEKPIESLRFRKVPYSFHCTFFDDDDTKMTLSILDWEITSLYRNVCLQCASREESKEKTLSRYSDFIEKNDLYFMLGTRNRDHNLLINSKNENLNPWSIISVMPFPSQYQRLLFHC